MEIAKSLYLGGIVIHADNSNLNASYHTLGLRCYYCGEPVLYRNGNINQPHFAHFPDIHPVKMETCLFRQKTQTCFFSWSDIYSSNGKQQRFRIFQDKFLELITHNIYDFEQGFESVHSKFTQDKLQSLLKDVINELKEKRGSINLFYRLTQYKNPMIDVLQRTIATESLDYLCVKSSRIMLLKVIYYCIYLFYKNSKVLFFQEQDYKEICILIADFIFQTNWKEAFCRIQNHVYIKPIFKNKELYVVLEDGCIFVNGKSLIFLREIEKYKVEKHILGTFLDKPSIGYISRYPYDVKFHIIDNDAYKVHAEKIEIFKKQVIDTLQNPRPKHLLPMPVSKRKKLHLSQNKREILLGSYCLALIEPQYQWHLKSELQLEDFFAPERMYQLFIEFHPEAKQALAKLFDDRLKAVDIKIPFKIFTKRKKL